MARVKARDTKPELALRKALYQLGVRGWRCHRADLPGRPDIAFGRAKLAVFVDGGFWHGHPDRFTPGKSGRYWDEKIERNMERDRQANAALVQAGWRVMRLWDFEVTKDPLAAATRVVDAIAGANSTRA